MINLKSFGSMSIRTNDPNKRGPANAMINNIRKYLGVSIDPKNVVVTSDDRLIIDYPDAITHIEVSNDYNKIYVDTATKSGIVINTDTLSRIKGDISKYL